MRFGGCPRLGDLMEDLVRPVTREHGLAEGQAIRVGELEFGVGASKRAPHGLADIIITDGRR
jgi:hypothetical protein